MNAKTFFYPSNLVLGIVLGAGISLAQAGTYTVQEITKEEVGNTEYFFNAGNQFLNNKGQVVGSSRHYRQNKLYNDGYRGFIWQQGRFKALETFGTDATGYGVNIPAGINNKGQVAGSSIYYDKKGIDKGLHAFLGSPEPKDIHPGSSGFVTSEANAINDNGQAAGIGRLYKNGMDKGLSLLLWTKGKAKNLSSPVDFVTAMNNSGQVVGNTSDQLGYYAFIWFNDKLQYTGSLGVDSGGFGESFAIGINDKGEVIGYSSKFDSAGNWLGGHAFLWVNGVMQDLGALSIDPDGVGYSFPVAINVTGEIIGFGYVFDGYDYKGQHAIMWLNGKLTDMGVLGIDAYGTESSYPNAINATGQIVGYSSYSENGVAKGDRAFIYQNGKMLDLNTLLPATSLWVLDNGMAINDQGQITAHAYLKSDETVKGYVLLTP
jgi:probable HAF family extracellular repeat protein